MNGSEGPASLMRSSWMPPLALLVIVVAAWGVAVHDGTVTRDTAWLVVGNPVLRSGSLSALGSIFFDLSPATRDALGLEYLPIRDLTVLADFAAFGERWAFHYAHSIAWYAAGCLFAYAFLARLLPDRAVAFAVAGLFAAHPVHAENVAWLAGRKDVVSMAFFFAALWAATFGPKGGLVSALLYVLAMWSKNTAVALPACLLLVIWLRRDSLRSWTVALLLHGLVAVVLVALSVRLGAQGGIVAGSRTDGPLELLVLQGRMLLVYLDLFAWTGHHAVVHAEPGVIPLARLQNAVGLFALGCLVAVALATRRRAPVVTFGLGWFFATMLPTSQIVPLENLIADRYLLLPSLGLILAAVFALPARFRPLSPLLLLALVPASISRALVWRDDVSLWEDARRHAPDVGLTWTESARRLDEAGREVEARTVREEALRRFAMDAEILGIVGGDLFERGDREEAESVLRRAVALDPGEKMALNNLVVLLNETGRAAGALPYADALVRAHPHYAQGLNTAGVAHLRTGDPSGAARLFLSAAPLPSAACNLGLAYRQLGRIAEADSADRRCMAR